MPNLDEQVEAIRAAMRDKRTKLDAELPDSEIIESTPRPLENEAVWNIFHKKQRDILYKREERVLRTELAILMDEHFGSFHISNFLGQHSEALVHAMYNRLSNEGHYTSKNKIRLYLRFVRYVFKAALANGIEISAVPYLEDKLNTIQKQAPKRGRPVERKKGKKRPTQHKGRNYQSIAEAARNDGQTSYAALKQKVWREDKKNSL